MADAESLPPPAVVRVWRRPPGRIVVLLGGCIAPDDVTAMLDRVRDRLEAGRADIVCDVTDLERADLAAVDLLARLALEARRLGATLRLGGPSPDLRQMVALAGLQEVLPCADGSVLDSERQAELRKEPRGVEEERDPADPVARQLEDLE